MSSSPPDPALTAAERPATRGSTTRSFGRYQVLKTLGSGAMGEVFLARDELLAREVAVKTLRPLGLGGSAAESFRARFLNEARAVASLSHPHVVRVFDLGFEGDAPYLVMELVGGSSLSERHKSGRRLSVDEVRALGIQLSSALEAAHARGIIHRDVKPANVLEAEPGVWKLADFGVAHVPDSSLTMTGQFIGSPAYSAPEALLAGEFSPATDIYGIGATLYEALAGHPPYGGLGSESVSALARRMDPQAITVHRPDVPADLARVIHTTLSRDPAMRPSAAELSAALAGAKTGAPRSQNSAAHPAAELSAAHPAAELSAALAGTVAVPTVLPSATPPVGQARAQVAQVGRAKEQVSAALRSLSQPGRRRWVIGGAAVALLLALYFGLSGPGKNSGPAEPGGPSFGTSTGAGFPGGPPGWQGPDQQEQWQKALSKLNEGKVDEAARELEKILRKNPYDQQARNLLEQIAGGAGWREEE